MKWPSELKKIKIYVAICLLGYSIFTWATISGYKILGDDNESKEEPVGRGRTNSFYHK